MKIGIYDPYLDTMSGGEKYMLSAAVSLSSKHRVNIFWDNPDDLEAAGNKLNLDLGKIHTTENIFSHSQSFTARFLQTRGYDRLFILSDGSIPFTLAKKTILHFQFPVEWVPNADLKNKLKFSRIHKVICNSYFTKKFIDKKFGINSRVIYPPSIRTEDLVSDLKKQNKKNIILSVGRFSSLGNGSSIKKQEVMIKIFKKMVDEGLKNWQLILAVSSLPKEEKNVCILEKSVKDYPITVLKNINFAKLNQIYADAKLYWHAAGFGEDLERHPEKAEHFGITTVEAIAHRAVPVVFDGGGQPEIVEDGVNGQLWQTEEELAQKTKKLMLDEKLRLKMSDIGITKIKAFTTEKFAEQILEAFS